jgi:2-amino-4-hydroxy-6-hydroxymethyldihydropteridine diphosphokinase
LSSDAYIGLGSNLGDRPANIRRALSLLASPVTQVLRVSSLLDNPAVGGPPGSPDFLNAAAEISTTLPPREFLSRLLEVESELGRVRRQGWDDRVIDLDLLLYGDLIVDEPGLSIPHPRLHQRRFVLQPLAQIAPNLLHPRLGRPIQALLDEIPPLP